MTTASASPLVRPRFLKWSIVAFVLLIPFVVHAVWDYVETRRLEASIEKIRARHEPVTSHDIQPSRIPTGEAADAARYYRAAAALVGPEWDEENRTRLRARIASALVSDAWPDALAADLRSRVSRDGDVFHLLDRATPLPFEGFGPGSNFSVRRGEMETLMRVAPLRTRLLALDANGDGAMSSFYAELRLIRTLEGNLSPSVIHPFTFAGMADTLRLIVNRSHPDAEALSSIASRLREMDPDDRLRTHLLRARASLFDTGSYQGIEMMQAGRIQSLAGSAALARPWMMQRLNERIDTLNVLIEHASKPWPERIDAPSAAYLSDLPRWGSSRQGDSRQLIGVALDIALIRCARLVVAVEQYRLAHGGALPPRIEDVISTQFDAVPIDPFSGKPLRFVAEEHGYMVYSFGPNRHDDGGHLAVIAGARPLAPMEIPANDFGIRISHR